MQVIENNFIVKYVYKVFSINVYFCLIINIDNTQPVH